MTNTELICKHITLLECEKSEPQKCKVCGQVSSKHFSQKSILSEKFNDYDECKSIKSDRICVFCASCIKNADLRRSCFYADLEKIIFFKKNDIENIVFDAELKPPFILCVTESFKKHNSFKAVVNYSANKFYIQKENERFAFDRSKMKSIYEVLKKAYFEDLMSKDEILTGKYTTLIEIPKLFEYENFFKQHRENKYFEFLVYILNSETKNEILKKRKEELKNARKTKKSARKESDNSDVEQLRFF